MGLEAAAIPRGQRLVLRVFFQHCGLRLGEQGSRGQKRGPHEAAKAGAVIRVWDFHDGRNKAGC